MPEEGTGLDTPIDFMRLVHKALRAEAALVEQEAGKIEPGGTLQPFRAAFNEWASVLLYLSEKESALIAEQLEWPGVSSIRVAPHGAVPPARAGESERTTRARLAVVAENENEHLDLAERLQDVLTVLSDEIGRTSIISRTKQHLCGSVLALRITQEDHLDNEAAFVLPALRNILSEPQQLAAAKTILIDEQSEDPRWVVDWVARAVSDEERHWLSQLESALRSMPASAGQPAAGD